MNTCKFTESVEKWGTFEAEMPGKKEGNPFTDYAIQGTFKGKEETKTVDGFYDGDGIYRVRFMPSFEGEYAFEIKGSFYDYTRPWITHCSIQRQDLYKTSELVNEWRVRYKKPIILDEIAYEGNIQHGWGNISGKEMTRRFWEAFCRGAYPGHGETYMNEEGILWWSHGGKLHGESPERFKFLQKIMEETPAPGLCPLENQWDEVGATVDNSLRSIKYFIFYYSFMRPSFREYHIDDETEFEVEVIDTWNMTIEKKGIFKGKFRIDLPGREYMAVRVREIR